MAVVNRYSEHITNVVAGTATNSNVSDGRTRQSVGYITPATDDTQASIGRLCRIPSNCRVSALTVSSADFTTAGACDIGLYYALNTDGSGGTALDVDFFATALDFSGGPFADLTCINESTTNTLAKQAQPIWQAAGLTSDPGGYFDVAYTITTTFNGGQPILMKCSYVV